jgi:ATP-binding cassette subfamily C protein
MPIFRSLLAELAAFGRWRLWRGVAFAVASAGLEGVSLLMLLPLLASVGVAHGRSWPLVDDLSRELGLPGLLVLWCGAVAALSWFAARREGALARLNQDFVRHLRIRLHRAILGLDWSAFHQIRSADMSAALIGATTRVGIGLTHLVQMLAGMMLVAIHATIAFSLAPHASLVAVAAGLVLAVVQIPRLHRMNRHGAAVGAGMRNVHATVSEHLAAMKMAKSHNAESVFARAFARDIQDLADSTVVGVEQAADSRARLRIGAALLMAGMVWVAVERLEIGGAPLLLLIAVFARLLPAVGQVAQSALRVAEMLPAYDEVEAMRRHCEGLAAPAAVPDVAAPEGPVRLEAVTYVWPGRDRPAIDGLTLEIPRNRTIALVGPSGAGKSTLADLCLGLLEPSAGQVQVGGVLLEGARRAAWRDRCAVVPQEVFLFHDTVRANLEWANPRCSEEQLWQALEAASADRMVRGLPQGLETVVGDRGLRLSGGERQRLALARALLRAPSFLVLDEATSHLDHEHERMIQRSLDRLRGRMTVLIVAHRLSTVRHADLIAVVEDGRLREAGGWARLRASGGFVAAGLDDASPDDDGTLDSGQDMGSNGVRRSTDDP